MEPDWDEFARRGLYDPDAPNAEERRDLIRSYLEREISVEAMVQAADRGRLVTLLGDLGIRPSRDRFTLEELADQAGVDRDIVRAALRAAGLPAAPDDLRYFGDADLEWFEGFRLASELFGAGEVLHFVRALGTAASRVAAGALHLAAVNFSGPLELAGATEVERSEANQTAVVALDTIPQVMETIFRHHVEHELRRSLLSGSEPGSRTANLAVAFLDLVGFTSVSATLGPDELAGVVTGFEGLAGDVIAAHDARLVKVIGDEVMYVTHDPRAACEIALGVSDAVDAHPALTAIRGGITYGPVLALDGDYYGNEVNLAARLVATAQPGQVLVTGAVADPHVLNGFGLEPIGSHALKGFDEPVDLFALARG